jgi:hypothetical protein
MSLNFLSPLYLFGILGIVVPILIHRLTRQKQKYQRFSAVYLLMELKSRCIKRSTPNRIFLLIIRCMAIVLLSMAMANPIFSFNASNDFATNNPSANVFIVDDSYSMGTQVNQDTYYSSAVKTVREIIQFSPNKSTYTLVSGSSSGRVLQEWTDAPGKIQKILKSNQPSARTTDIGQAIKQALRLLESVSKKNKHIYILTDRDTNGWDKNYFSAIETKIQHPIHIIDFSEMRPGINQAAVTHSEAQQTYLNNSRMVKVKIKAANLLKSKPINKLNVSLWVDGKKKIEGTMNIDADSSAEKELSFPLQSNDFLNGEIRIENDLLITDNIRFFSHQPDQTIKTLVVDGNPNTVEHLSETFYLERALNPFGSSHSNIELTLSTPGELPRLNLLDFSVIVLCNLQDLPYGYEQELEKYTLRGGALFITLGDQVNTKFYNEKLGGILPVFLKGIHTTTKNKEPFRFLIQPSKHPVLNIFKGKALEEMKSTTFNTIYSIEAREGSNFTTPITFKNKFPALIESTNGKGKVFLFTSSIDRDWNNFPIQPTFLPWIQRWIKYSARGLDSHLKKNLLVGEPFYLQKSLEEPTIYITSPEGKVTYPGSINGKIEFQDTDTPGVYKIHQDPNNYSAREASILLPQIPYGAKLIGSFNVNIDPIESISEKISNDEIKRLLPEANITFSSGHQKLNIKKTGGSRVVSTFILTLMGIMFLLEGWLVRRE